jgi:hypothetical protein
MNTAELIAAAKAAQGVTTDYAMAKLLDTQPVTVANWVKGRNLISDKYAIRAAELAGLDAAKVLVWLAAERAEGEARRLLQKLAASLVVLLVAVVVWSPSTTWAAFHEIAWKQEVVPKTAYYVKRALRALFRLKERVCMSLQGAILWTCKHATR